MKRIAAATVAGLAALLAIPAAPASADVVRAGQWYLSALHVRSAWHTTRGAGATACVIDSGIDDQVPDLRGAVKDRKQFTKYVDSEGLVTSHGTGVASVLAGRGHGPNSSDGVIGIAPQAKLLDAVVGDSDPNIERQAANAVRWCTKNGAGVINMSFTVQSSGPLGAAVRYAQSKDVVLVAASSNTFENLHINALPDPAGLPGVLAVTGVDKNLRHDDGAFTSSAGKAVSLAAPFSTTPGANGYPDVGLPAAGVPARDNGQQYPAHAVGTSFSSPIVAGTVALVRAAHPKMSANDVIAAVLASATPAGSGRPNRTYGWGVLDVGAAVGATLRPSSGNPVETGKVPAPVDPPAPRTRSTSRSTPMRAEPDSSPAAPRSVTSQAPGAAQQASGGSSGTVWWGVLAAVLIAAAGVTTIVRRRSGH